MDGIAVLIRTRFPHLRSCIRIPAITTDHQKVWLWVIAACWLAINVALYFAWDTVLIYLAGYAVAFCLYRLQRILNSFKAQEDRAKWVFYMIVIILSALGNYQVTEGLLLSTLPFVYLGGYRFYRNDQAFIMAYFPE